GILASKIATELRLRKIAGADETTANIGEINARLRELNDCFTKQLKEARDIQMDVVPKSLPFDERFDMCAAYEPLEDVGGDWYFARQLPSGRLSVQIADVTGHGLSAAFIACMTKLALMAADKENPAELLTEMNKLMSTCIPAGKFVTMFSYLYDPETGKLGYARAGHPPALLLKRKEGLVKQLTGEGFAVGFFEDSEYKMETEQLDIGDVLMVYTDVLPESQNMSGQTYDYERMSNVLLRSAEDASSAEILRSILEDFDEFRDGRILKDDLTSIVIKRKG
ncbi:MAG: serine/threonine-protein phosphatase, partial [Bdellovibrionales bacterium]|nr:serine/threonine-protein phosphatase [Bdellovibrionales bacterium]